MIYSFIFAEKLIKQAETAGADRSNKAAIRVLYLSCQSCEQSLGAVLQSAGFTPEELRKLNRKLDELLREFSFCSIRGTNRRATAIRSKTVVPDTSNGTVGTLLTASSRGASEYPNEINEDVPVKHYPARYMLECARVVLDWCREHEGRLVRYEKLRVSN